MSREETPAYIARCKKCEAIIMATVDIPEHAEDVANDVADCIRRGFKVERVTVGYVHKNGLTDCTCTQANKRVQSTVLPVREIEIICPNCNLVIDVPVPTPHSG